MGILWDLVSQRSLENLGIKFLGFYDPVSLEILGGMGLFVLLLLALYHLLGYSWTDALPSKGDDDVTL